MRLKLVHALVGIAHAHDEAQLHTTKPKVLAALAATSEAADQAARLVQFDQLDQATPRQLELIHEAEKEISQ